MFAIYNNGRVGFRSTTDNLYNLKDVEEIQESRLKPDEGFIEYFAKYNANKKADTKENAISTYKKMANIDTLEEIFHVKDIMTKDCIYIDSKSTVQEAYDVLKEFKIGQMSVVTFGKKILGVIDKKMILNILWIL
jgi:CBS domain-containing protein